MKDTILVFLAAILAACQPRMVPQQNSGPNGICESNSSFHYSLTAINLTEDVSRVSSSNDEILLLMYAASDKLTPLQTLERQLLTFDKTHPVFEHQVSVPLDSSATVVVVLIEIDSERKLEEVNQVVSRQLAGIAKAYRTRQSQQLRKFLEDEDLLGLEVIPVNAFRTGLSKTLVFKGFHLFDEYEYELLIQSEK
jgi:hypothetical protein